MYVYKFIHVNIYIYMYVYGYMYTKGVWDQGSGSIIEMYISIQI
jgi:hypothetical protein